MSSDQKKIFSGGGMAALLLMAVMVFAAFYRFKNGLGASTNLTDETPWGLWVAIDVLVGAALAAGGCAIIGAVYILNMKKYRPILRAAVLSAFIGNVLVTFGLIIDIGKPMAMWHPLVYWNPQSVMFGVVWCVVLYTSVLALEFAGPLCEGLGAKKAAEVMTRRGVLVPLAIAAMTLSFLHHSSLGTMFLIMPAKLNHLWWTTILPYNFFISAIAAGLAMVCCEYAAASRVFKHDCDMAILCGLAKGTAFTLLLYFLVRFADLIIKGNLSLLAEGGAVAKLFMIEMFVFTLLPMLLLFKNSGSAKSSRNIILPQILVLLGVIMNRLDVLFLVQEIAGESYWPSFIEWAITAGFIATITFTYRFAVLKLPIIGSSGSLKKT